MSWQELRDLVKDTYLAWDCDKCPRLGASLAFYTALSMAPIVVVALAIAGFFFGEKAAQGELVWQIRDLVGPDGAKVVEAMVQGAGKKSNGVFATILGLITLFFGAGSVVTELRDALNTIWKAPPARFGFYRLAKDKFFSFTVVLGVGFLLLVSLAVSTVLVAVGAFFNTLLPMPEWALQMVNFLVSFVVISLLFGIIYKVIPDVKIEWKDVVLGSAVTSFLFTIGKLLIGLYLGRATFSNTYGAAGSLVVFLVWVYYSAQIFFFGAEFTRTYTYKLGSRSHELTPAD